MTFALRSSRVPRALGCLLTLLGAACDDDGSFKSQPVLPTASAVNGVATPPPGTQAGQPPTGGPQAPPMPPAPGSQPPVSEPTAAGAGGQAPLMPPVPPTPSAHAGNSAVPSAGGARNGAGASNLGGAGNQGGGGNAAGMADPGGAGNSVGGAGNPAGGAGNPAGGGGNPAGGGGNPAGGAGNPAGGAGNPAGGAGNPAEGGAAGAAAPGGPAPLVGEPLAFPGAEGFGRLTSGGRGGDVYVVTNLNDSGAGSLRQGITSAAGPRTIVFQVSGNIELQSSLDITADNLTIAGQTAPEGGITVSGYNTLVEADNVIVRFLRFRCGDFNVYDTTGVKPPRGNGDLKGGNADAISVIHSKNVILDHVSASWSVDESLSVTWSNDVTVQNSIISEPLNDSYLVKNKDGMSYLQPHAFGSLVRANNNDGGGYTYYRNLYAHCDMRNPGVGPNQDSPTEYKVKLDFVNNVIYGWGQRQGESIDGSKGGRAEINMVGNYYVANGDSDDPNAIWDDEKYESVYAYQEDNKVDGNRNGQLDGSVAGWSAFQNFSSAQQISSRWDYPQVTTTGPDEAYSWVRDHVGASVSRDAVDARIIEQMQSNRGTILDSQEEVGGLPDIPSQLGPSDGDKDGMPDEWETQMGLNPAAAVDGQANTLHEHYTNLEVYLNSLAAAHQ